MPEEKFVQFQGSVNEIENTKNKTNEITEDSTDQQYPSAKATFELFKKNGGSSGVVDQTYNPESENAQSGKAVAEAIDNALSDMGNLFAPVIKQTVSGDVITVNDVSPIEHNLKVNVKSKNLLPPTLNVPLPYTKNGVTVSQIRDGVALSGNLTGPNSFAFSLGTVRLPAGTYILGGLTTIGTNSETSNIFLMFPDSISNSITLTEEKDVPITVNVGHYEKTTIKVDALVYPVVISAEYVGTVAKFDKYIPYNMDFSDTTVKKYGINLFNINTDKTLKSAANIEVSNGVLKLTKTASSPYCCARLVLPVKAEELHGKTVYFQGRASRDTGLRICIGYSDVDASNYANKEEKYTQDFSMSIVVDGVTNTNKYLCLQLYIDNSQAGNAGDYIEYSDLRGGVVESNFFPYIEPQTAKANADGTVNGLVSNSNMTLLVNNDNAVLECKYNVDTKTYIDNKFAELSAALLNL